MSDDKLLVTGVNTNEMGQHEADRRPPLQVACGIRGRAVSGSRSNSVRNNTET